MLKKIVSILLTTVFVLSCLSTFANAQVVYFGMDNFSKRYDYENSVYKDINEDDWFYGNVVSAYELGLMNGKGNHRFDPSGNITVAETITIASRLHSIYFSGSDKFTESDPWYQSYLDYAAENNLIYYFPGDPNEMATRDFFVSIINSAFPNEEYETVNSINEEDIPDLSESYDKDAVMEMYRAGIINGNDKSNTFAPERNIRRSEVAAILSRMVDKSLRIISADYALINDFGIRLFRETYEKGKNVMLSPVSVITALAMTANGANGKTLEQMENVFGTDVNNLNEFLMDYIRSLPNGESSKVHMANSIWIKDTDDLSVEKEFTEKNIRYYNSEVVKAAFDKQTLKDINNWVKSNTDDMIPTIIDEIPDDAVMYLINALAFDSEWDEKYYDTDVWEDVFTDINGKENDVEFMHANVYEYIEDEDAVGFIKNYIGERYAYVALLPDNDIQIEDYIKNLNGLKLSSLISSPEIIKVKTSIPKYESEYSNDLAGTLEKMGMEEAFKKSSADFSLLGSFKDGNISIDSVVHKTYIEVSENGTKAAAATSVGMVGATAVAEESYKTVYLNRPFVYMIYDREYSIPLFIGVMESITK